MYMQIEKILSKFNLNRVKAFFQVGALVQALYTQGQGPGFHLPALEVLEGGPDQVMYTSRRRART